MEVTRSQFVETRFEIVDPRFGGGVGGNPGQRLLRRHRGNIQDDPLLAPGHFPSGSLGRQDRTEEVEIEDVFESLPR